MPLSELMQIEPEGQSRSLAQGRLHMPVPKSLLCEQRLLQSRSVLHKAPTSWPFGPTLGPPHAPNKIVQSKKRREVDRFKERLPVSDGLFARRWRL